MRVSAQALPKSFRALCKERSEATERSEALSYPWPEIRTGDDQPLPVDLDLPLEAADQR
jgi:hypothetical protein